MKEVAAITGIGCISPLGVGCPQTDKALRAGYDGISPVSLFPTSAFQATTAGHVPYEFLDLAAQALPASRDWTRAAQMVLLAMLEAVEEGFVPEIVIVATTSGGMDFGQEFYRGLQHGQMSAKQARRWTRGYVPHQPVLDVMEVLGWTAPVRTVSNACASGTNALGLAAGIIARGEAKRVLVVGFDALCEMVFAGFDSLRAATREKCRPFDRDRTGLVLGEAAAVFCLEALSSARHTRVVGTIPGYGFANDNHHLTQPEPGGTGPRLSMQRALASAGWTTVDYINAHGTGTAFNDASEAAAIGALLPHVPVSSTKGMTGHTLGAAGAIEAAFCLLAMRGAYLPPNINLRESDSGLDIVANTARSLATHRMMSNSFGFGGANASILLENFVRQC